MIIKESINDCKMYIENNPAEIALLVTDGNKWLYVNEYALKDCGIRFSEDNNKNVRIVKDAIVNGNLYSAEDFMDNFEMFERFYIPEYDGMNIDDIDNEVNYKEDSYNGVKYPLGHDYTTWIEV